MEAFELAGLVLTWKVGLNAGVSALCSAFVTIFVIFSIERFGGIIGGVIATVPSTIVPTSIGLALTLTGDDDDFSLSMNCVPPGVLLNILLLVLWRVILPKMHFSLTQGKRVALMVLISMVTWVAGAVGIGFFIAYLLYAGTNPRIATFASLGLAIVIWIIISSVSTSIGAKGEGKIPYKVYIFGAFVSLAASALAIIFSTFNDVASGLAISFPAILLVSLVSLSISYSDTLSVSATLSMIGGSISIGVYAVVVAELLPALDKVIGSDGHWAVAILASLLTWVICIVGVSTPILIFLKWRESKSKNTLGKIVFEDDVNMLGVSREILPQEFGDIAAYQSPDDEPGSEYRPLLHN